MVEWKLHRSRTAKLEAQPMNDSTDPGLQEKMDDEIGLVTLAGIDTAAT